MRAFLCALTVLATAAQAQAQAPRAQGDVAGFDIIHDVPPVQSIAIDAAGGGLFAALAPDGEGTGSAIVQWHLDPVRRAALWQTETIVSDIEISPRGLVYAAGQRAARPGGPAGSRSGMVITVDPARPADPPAVFISFPDNARVDFPRYSQAAHDGEERIFVTTPTQFTVAGYPERPFHPGETPRELRLRCGVPAQFSLFGPPDRPGYVASTADGALLEAGLVQPDPAASPGGCFRVANVFSKDAPATLNSVVHAVLADAGGTADAVLALEPNTGTLDLLRLDGVTQQLSRAGSADLGAGGGAFTLLAASRDGAVILVGGPAREAVLRFRREGDGLALAGTLWTGTGLRQIGVGADGSLAALVIRGAGGLDRIHLIRAPGALADGAAGLPPGGDSLRLIQSALNEAGFDAGPADGIAGPRTTAAVSAALARDARIESDGFDVKSMIEGVFMTPLD
jgi:hypothetical protein